MVDADTIAAVATAPGVGGVGVVRVSGRLVGQVVEEVVGRPLRPRVATFVRFSDETGAPIDEGLALFFSGPSSYTGEDVLEIQAHGGPVVLNRLLSRCLAAGARLAAPGEFTKRAFLNGKIDLAQAEAVADLIAARTDQAARSAARSLAGEFSRQISAFRTELTELRVVVEGSIDFPDEGIDFVREAAVAGRLEALRHRVDEAVRAGETGRKQQEGLCAVLVGAPNAGKSSIINGLCMDDVAIVSPFPGTTRDLVRAPMQVDGIPIELIDTAGLRITADPVEGLGIERTYRAVETADIVVVVIDGTGESVLDEESLARLPSCVPWIRVHNKIDLTGELAHSRTEGRMTDVWVSAKTGAGLPELRRALGGQNPGAASTAIAARARHLEALRECRSALSRAENRLEEVELVAEELRSAQNALGQITGEFVADDLLGEIFSRFCIGK
jgi:tRNA modification GTPase